MHALDYSPPGKFRAADFWVIYPDIASEAYRLFLNRYALSQKLGDLLTIGKHGGARGSLGRGMADQLVMESAMRAGNAPDVVVFQALSFWPHPTYAQRYMECALAQGVTNQCFWNTCSAVRKMCDLYPEPRVRALLERLELLAPHCLASTAEGSPNDELDLFAASLHSRAENARESQPKNSP
jgi:hypothetical protein